MISSTSKLKTDLSNNIIFNLRKYSTVCSNSQFNIFYESDQGQTNVFGLDIFHFEEMRVLVGVCPSQIHIHIPYTFHYNPGDL